jgi:hypothetical protein
MKKLINILLLSVLTISNYSYAEELYKENIYIAKYDLENKKRRAEFVAEIDRGKRTESRLRPIIRNDLNSTQELYYFIDNIRYKAQLLENQVNSMTGEAEHKAKSAQAAQVHWLDLLNVVSSRLPTDKANVNKRFTLEEEIRRASVRADWTSQFLDYARGMRKFDDIFHHQTEMRNTIAYAERENSRAEAIYKQATSDFYNVSDEQVNKRFNKTVADAKAYVQSIIDAHNEFNTKNHEVIETLDDIWTVDNSTFNYTLPCPIETTMGVAIVVHGTNWRDIAVKDEEGNPIYPAGVSIAFDHMLDKCIAIVVPKSGLSAEVDWVGNITYSRDWWMSESTPRTIEGEVQATIDLINLAYEAIKKPIYLVYGHDNGVLASRVIIQSLLSSSEETSNLIGYIVVDKETGEYIGHNLNGTSWSSTDL